MTRNPGSLALRDHCQLSVIIPSPFSRRVEIDLLWTTKAVHWVIHLHAFPTVIVVILIKHEVKAGPTRGEEGVVTFLVRHVHQLVDLPPVVPLKAGVELRIALERGILMNK